MLSGAGAKANLAEVGAAATAAPNPQTVQLRFDQPMKNAAGQFLDQNGAVVDEANAVRYNEIQILLDRASAATASRDGIIAVVDRNGRILGVKVEDGVSPAILNDPAQLTFAIDGAVAKARTGAFFGNSQAPLNTRTINALSQSTITEREVDSNPSDTNPDSTARGPGVVAAVGLNAHFPADVRFTPQVDLFDIEYTNRDSTFHPGDDRIKGTPDDVQLDARFNINPAFIPNNIIRDGFEFLASDPNETDPLVKQIPPSDADARAIFNSLNQAQQRRIIAAGFIVPPDSYGFQSGTAPNSAPRGVATLPGGLAIFKVENFAGVGALTNMVGGIGVFYPGETGFATEENSRLNDFPQTGKDRSIEAEIAAFVAIDGFFNNARQPAKFGPVDGVAPVPGIGNPFGTITLVGITLDIVGPMGTQGARRLIDRIGEFGKGQVNGSFQQVLPNGTLFQNGRKVPEGYLVLPHDGVGGLTAQEVRTMIDQGRYRAVRTRAAIRLPLDQPAKFMYAVTDNEGNVLGLFRDRDATIFSIDVAVAKARNANYFADVNRVQAADLVPGIPPGVAFTARTFRYLAGPRFPQSIDGRPPGPYSKLNDANANFVNGRNKGAPVPASAFQSVEGYMIFNPGTNFREQTNVLNQNGIVLFPGSLPLYKDANGDGVKELVGGLGISGDGVDQDDIVTIATGKGFRPTRPVRRADEVFFKGVRLPFAHFNRFPRLRVAENGTPRDPLGKPIID